MKKINKQQKKLLQAIFIIVVGIFSILLGLDPGSVNTVAEPLQPGTFRVVSVADGDTIVVDMNGVEERVRFIGIDTPEKNHPQKPVQCFSQAATDFTKRLVENRGVRLEADPLSDNRDIYKRLLRYVYVDDTFVNYELVAQGYAFAYTIFPFSMSAQFENAENSARTNSIGLWGSCQLLENNNRYETVEA